MNKLSSAHLLYLIGALVAMWVVPAIREGKIIENYIYLSFTGLSAVCGVLAIKTLGISGQRARSLLMLAMGAVGWFVAELLWVVDFVPDKQISFPSIADLFFLAGYVLLFIGLLLEIRLANISFHTLNKRIVMISSIVAFVVIGAFFYFSVYLAYSPESELWENIVTIGYGLGDIVLIITSVFLIQLIWLYRGGKMSRVWYFLLASFIAMTIADFFYAIFFDQYETNSQPITNFINSFYYSSYALLAVYFLELHATIKKLQQKVLKPRN